MLRDSTVALVVVARPRPRAIPLAMKESIQGFPFLSNVSMRSTWRPFGSPELLYEWLELSWSVFKRRNPIFKSKTTEPLKVLSSSGMRGTYFIPLLQLSSSITCFVRKSGHFEFHSNGDAWHKALNNYVLIFSHLRSLTIRKSAYVNTFLHYFPTWPKYWALLKVIVFFVHLNDFTHLAPVHARTTSSHGNTC